MRVLLYLCVFSISHVFSQTIDYNIKTGFMANGYDVVAYFDGKAIKGSKKFVSEFDGVNYKFSSQENRVNFEENPNKYVPQYGGYCAYAIALKSNKVSINPKTFEIINDKLYLFYDAWGTNTLELWRNENEKELLEKAEAHWKVLKFL